MKFKSNLYIDGDDVIVHVIKSNDERLDRAYFNIYYVQKKVKCIPPVWANMIKGLCDNVSISLSYSGSNFYVDGYGTGFFNFNASEGKHIVKITGLNKEETFNKIKKLFNFIQKHNILNKIINELGPKKTLL